MATDRDFESSYRDGALDVRGAVTERGSRWLLCWSRGSGILTPPRCYRNRDVNVDPRARRAHGLEFKRIIYAAQNFGVAECSVFRFQYSGTKTDRRDLLLSFFPAEHRTLKHPILQFQITPSKDVALNSSR